jgi:hypothetical protein
MIYGPRIASLREGVLDMGHGISGRVNSGPYQPLARSHSSMISSVPSTKW